ncbi:DEAD-box_helicase [Hexamita inflata]|uniref:ATP-dependent RNA helicase n=1 Tax=Hexamita inflata TaxID=28002 RepID=A0ABP1GW48_9EUKA
MPPKKNTAEAPQAPSTASFADFNLRAELTQAITDNGFERPSDVQAQAIPYCLERRDVRVQAKSGKGKTCVFVLSVLNMIDFTIPGIQCVVLCNTRELALQIADEFSRFSKHLPAKSVTLIGKTPANIQIKQLQANDAQIVVGTIGRTADLIRRGDLKLDKLQFLVIDEADQLLTAEENKEPLADILAAKPECQTMVFSATFSPEAKELTGKVLREGFREVTVDDQQLVLHGLVQNYMKVTEQQKLDTLIELLKLKFTQAVVFTKSVERANVLSEFLNGQAIACKAFVGRMSNDKREELYRAFKKKDVRIIVCTDIFQRGVDFEGVNLVVHFDMPDETDAYLHRSGRAGRFETNGLVVGFVASEEDNKILESIQSRFAVKIQEINNVAEIDVERAFLAK